MIRHDVAKNAMRVGDQSRPPCGSPGDNAMILSENQFDLFDPTAGRRNTPPSPPRGPRWLRSAHEVCVRREVRRWSDFQLENRGFGLLTRPWFWPWDVEEMDAIKFEQRRRQRKKA